VPVRLDDRRDAGDRDDVRLILRQQMVVDDAEPAKLGNAVSVNVNPNP
jgi:hypothetical protein